MSIPLRRLMKVGGLRDCKVVAGHGGLDRPVSNVTVMEVPDIVKWLKGNELLLTSLYPIKDDPEEQTVLIERLAAAGTTALAIKPARFVAAIPEVMKEKADELHIPLIEIPEQISYLDILSPAMNAIFNEKVVLQEDLEYATRLLDQISITNGTIEQFLETLAMLTKSKVYLESYVPYVKPPLQEDRLLPMTPEQLKELGAVQRPIRMTRRNVNGEEESCIVAPIVLEGDLYGAITCWSYHTGFMEVDLAIQEKAASLLSLQCLREKIKHDVEQNYKTEFIRDLLFNQDMNARDLLERGQYFGYQYDERYFCIIVNTKEQDDAFVFKKRIAQIQAAAEEIEPGMIAATIRHSLLLLVPGQDKNEQQRKRIVEAVMAAVEKLIHRRVNLGVGSAYEGIKGLRKSFAEAEKAITLGSDLWVKKSIHYFDALGVYRLISLLEDQRELKEYYEESMKQLAEYSEDKELNLIETLEAYFACDESLKKTADLLYIHVNTLKYRLQKVKQITGLNIHHSEDKLMLLLGLKIHHYYSSIIEKDKNSDI